VSNTPKTGNGHFSLATYRAEAAKKGDKKGDFVLDVDTDKSISVPRPSGDQMFEAEQAMRSGDSKQLLQALCGDQADEIIELLGAEDAAVLRLFGEDLQKHFGLGE
jgi:hypothetical protein